MRKVFLTVVALCCYATFATAQMVGDCVFLKGKYVEVGIAPNGGYGSTLDAPAGYHPNLTSSINFYDPGAGTSTTSTLFLGFVADYGKDGWTVGTPPYWGDYYLPGTPQEGWAIKIGTGTESNAYIPSYQAFGSTGYTGLLTGTNTTYTNFGGVSRGIWNGTHGPLAIKQTTTLDTNKLYFTVNVIMRNTGATTLNDIYYFRTVDPDNEQTRSGSFTTVNTITNQLPNLENKVLVSAVGNGAFASNAYLGLGTKDCRAKCMIFDFGLVPGFGTELDAIWNETGGASGYAYNQGFTNTSDVGIGLLYKIATLAPGDSTTLTYAYILNAAYIDSALDATQPAFLVNELSFETGDTVNLCEYNFDTMLVSMGSGAFYNWHWAPNLLITDTTAVSNVIDVTGISAPITYTITGVNVSGGCDTVRYNLTLIRGLFDVVLHNHDTTICRGSSFAASVTGSPLLDYSWSPAAGVSNVTAMNPTLSPTVTTTYTLTVSSTTGCPPIQKFLTVSVLDPTFTSVTGTNPTACGYTDGRLLLSGLQVGFPDTVFYMKDGTPQLPIPTLPSASGTITVNGLGQGVYSNIYVKVGLCPTVTRGPVSLIDPPPPTITVDSNYVKTCVNNSTQLHVYAFPNTVPYFYNWSPPAYLSNAIIADPIVTPTVGGDIVYTVSVNPSALDRCKTTDTVRVHVLDAFSLNNIDTVICLGSVVNTRVTGSNEYTYNWTPALGVSDVNIKTPTINPGAHGTYTYYETANYANCAEQIDSFKIEVDTPATPKIIVDTICLGMTYTHDFTVPGTGGTAEYNYLWTAPATSLISATTIPNPVVQPGVTGLNIYTVQITPTAATCRTFSYLNLLVLPNSITVRPTDTMICEGNSVPAFGFGSDLFSYHWIPTTGIPTPDNKNIIITTDTSAVYTLTASFRGCPDMTATLNLDVQPNPTVYVGGNRFLCQYDTLRIMSSVSPGWYTGYTYNWTPSADLDHNNTPTVVFSGLDTAKLILEVSTPAGCTAKDSAIVNVIPGDFMVSFPDYNLCPGDSAVLMPSSSVSGVSYHFYPWYYLSDSVTTTTTTLKAISNTTYTVVATNVYGCKDTTKFDVVVHPAGVITLDDELTLYPGETVELATTSNCATFSWFPITGLSSAVSSNPIANPEVSTTYFVTGYTENGCEAKDSIAVNVNSISFLAMPNAFTPGSGGANAYFKPNIRGAATLNYFRIYNRWGNTLFETKDITKGWDGTYNGTPQPYGVYIYEIQAVDNTGKPVTKSGNVTLLR